MSYRLEIDNKDVGSVADVYAWHYRRIAADSGQLVQSQTRIALVQHEWSDSGYHDIAKLAGLAVFGGADGHQNVALRVSLGDFHFDFPAVAAEYHHVVERPSGSCILVVFCTADGTGADFTNWTRPDQTPSAVRTGRPLVPCTVSCGGGEARTALEIHKPTDITGRPEVLVVKNLSATPLFASLVNARVMPSLHLKPSGLTLYQSPYNSDVLARAAFADGVFRRAQAHLWNFASPAAELGHLRSQAGDLLTDEAADGNRDTWYGAESGHPEESLRLTMVNPHFASF